MKTLQERFWAKVNKQSDRFGIDGLYPTECWEWIGAKMTQGYGHMRVNGKNRPSHRILFELEGIVLTSKDCILHKCDNRCCVNPDHLIIGTQRENALDMAQKGRARGPVGINNANSKLTEENVRVIRNDIALGCTYQELASRFHVSRPTISYLAQGKTWKHVK